MFVALLGTGRTSEISTDLVIINAMFEVGKTVHDSINALSFADDIRQISTYIAAFIKKVDYGDDLEKQLNFYVDCRYVCLPAARTAR
jgi:hypothetical protein